MSQNLKQRQMTPSRKSVRLAFKCTGLECEPSVSFQTGMLSGLLNRAKSTATSKTERRSILASVSTSSSGFFDVYRSEVIDDSDDIYPSLVADIKYGAIADTLIRVRILYSCTMTSGKDIILCETVFPLHDIVRDTTIRVSMTSKYLKNNAILEMIVVEPFRPVLQSTSFAPIAKNNPGNPYKQSYMFYSDDISIPRAVYCEEYGLESRISVDVVVAFLDEILRSLSLSISSWARRRDLEIIRQGLFSSLNDAHKHGWHQVTITVLEVRINSTGNDNSPSQFGKVSPQHPSSLIGTDDDDDNNNTEIDKNGKRNPGARGFRRAITTLSGGGMSASRKKGAYDDSKPCTFVEISITDSSNTFSDPIGLTNIEYYSSHPVYGSNMNSNCTKNPQTEPQRGGEGVQIILEPKVFHFRSDQKNDSDNNSPNQSGINVNEYATEGLVAHFVRYVPNRTGTEVVFTLNQVLPEVSHNGRNHDAGDGGRTNGLVGESRDRLAQCTVSLESHIFSPKSPKGMIGTGDGGTGIGASKKTTIKKWLKSNDNENIEFLVMIEMDSPAHSDCNMNQNNFVGTDNTGKMLTVNQRRNVADSESNGSNVNNDYNGDRNRWNQYNDTDTNLSNINNVNKKKGKELIDLLGTSEMLLNCRNFEYQVGLDGFDPLAALPLSQPLHSSISFTSATVATTTLDSDLSSNYDNNINIKNDINIGNNNTNNFSNHNSNNNFDLLSLDDDITDNNSFNNNIYERENKCNNSNLLFTPAITKLIESNDEKKIKSLPRIDVEYPIPWLENYLVHLKELFQEFTTAKKNAVELLHKNCVFRSSTAKKIMTLQALPLNLHMQVMSVRSSLQKVDMNEEIKLKTKKDTSIDLEIDTDSDIEVNPPVEGVLDAITCGCLSPHGLGFSTKKGLDAMEGSLLSTKMRIDDLKKKLESNISKFKLDTSSGNNSIDDIYNVTDNKIGRLESTNQSNLMKEVERKNSNRNLLDDKNDEMDFIDIDNNNLQEKLKLSPKVLHHNSFAYKIKEKIGIEVLEYENSILKICQRRVYAISQAISITVSALIMKLTLIAENHIPPEVGEMWLLYGFLIVFEGLLSVSGNEKYMLEDTVTAVESLSTYQIKILPSSCNTKKKKNNYIDKDNFNLNDIIRFEADGIDDNINNQFNNNSSEDLNANNSNYANNSDKEKIEVNMNGREILIYFPAAALNSLPIEYQKGAHNGGAILRIVAVLFSQGIDIQQTLALAATSLSTMASQADAKSKANKPIPGPSSTGEKNERDTSEDSSAGTVNNLQHVVNVRGLALLEEYCCAFRPVDGDRDPSIPGGSSDNSGTFPASGSGSVFSTGSAAAMAKEQHDRYRSSLPSPSHEKMKNKKLVSRAASTTRNLSIAMHMTSAATSAAGSAVRAYGASYFKGNHENEKSNRSPGSSSLQMSLSSHPLLEELTEMILTSSNINSKNVDMLVAVERVCVMLGGCRVTFCKSGKDRTGMAVTYEQSRQLGERFGCGQSTQRILKDANIMRIHGVRIMIAEKNIGRRVYSINQLQAQFLPVVYRPPKEVLEDLLRKDDT